MQRDGSPQGTSGSSAATPSLPASATEGGADERTNLDTSSLLRTAHRPKLKSFHSCPYSHCAARPSYGPASRKRAQQASHRCKTERFEPRRNRTQSTSRHFLKFTYPAVCGGPAPIFAALGNGGKGAGGGRRAHHEPGLVDRRPAPPSRECLCFAVRSQAVGCAAPRRSSSCVTVSRLLSNPLASLFPPSPAFFSSSLHKSRERCCRNGPRAIWGPRKKGLSPAAETSNSMVFPTCRDLTRTVGP